MDPIEVFIEVGQKRVFAGAVDWPGWCRSGSDEETALAALLAYGPRYVRAAELGGVEFSAPQDHSGLAVVERLPGTRTTDFGAPDQPLERDARPVSPSELQRLVRLLDGCWLALEAAAQAAEGKELRLGPRGGGRDLERVLRHVVESSNGYQKSLAWKAVFPEGETGIGELEAAGQASVDALKHAVQDGLPEQGPRGGKIWLPRYYARRMAWHILDHAWELEDRILE